MKVLQNISIIILASLFFIQSGCTNKKLDGSIEPKLSFDGIEEIPEWLKVNVEEALPNDGLNVWIPTNNFQTSSLIRVPRFPRKFSDAEIENNQALKAFEILQLNSNETLKIIGVRNEQVSAQIAFCSTAGISNLSVKFDDLQSKTGNVFSKNDVQVRFVKYLPVQRARSEYVWSPKLENIIGEEVSGTMSPNVVADALMEVEKANVPEYRAQPVWLTFRIPKTMKPGIYEGNLTIRSDEYDVISQIIKLEVFNQEIPNPADYRFHLDLWLNPSAIAEYYGLEHWSDAHWDMISKYLDDYASRGGKNITTTITHEPWHKPWLNNSTRSQIAFGYRSMVEWIKNEDGSWTFDYSVFDKYVAMATNAGINEAINAFSMTPFHTKQKIQYFDLNDGNQKTVVVDIEDEQYIEVWSSFLKSFKSHLISKGLFERTYLGFDEKPEEVFQNLKNIIKKSAPEFLDKIVIAGHPETGVHAKNLSISYMFFPGQAFEGKAVVPVLPTIEQRNIEKKQTTFYLCAEPDHPNTLTYSPAIEAQLIPWLALKYNVDGYLRWAYNNWTKNPFKHPVFIHSQGDDYYVYPGKDGPVSSIRWELLKEGIEDYELFRLVKEKGNVSDKELQKAIELATRNEDGRYKDVNDFVTARNLILDIN